MTFRISFSPRHYLNPPTLDLESTTGDRLRINGELFNFNALNNGDVLPPGSIPSEWIVGPVEKIEGKVHVTVLLPHGADSSGAVAFPEPITVVEDGPIEMPHDVPIEEEERADESD